jgi:hypothetical protein
MVGQDLEQARQDLVDGQGSKRHAPTVSNSDYFEP